LTETVDYVGEQPFSSPVRLLQPEEVGRVRQSWDSRYSHADLRAMSMSSDCVVLWNPQTGEYVAGVPWRHRREALEVTEISGTGGALELVQTLVEEATFREIDLVLVPERAERRQKHFYVAAGFEAIQEIIIYELHNIRPPMHRPLRPAFERVDLRDPVQKQEVIELDHATFPWLWWNSPDEFDNYGNASGVIIELARDDYGAPLAYVGYTRLRGWGHLDRIAVSPKSQGRGLGRIALEYAVARMVSMGARRIGLSTQAENHVSRALYESFGFQRNRAHDYLLYGRWTGERRET
jgi:ribosomal protein S18 acetylase RimI-like enzyme